MRSISMAVNGAYITKDNENAGVQGEANVTQLDITFDESWDGLAKKCTWWDAKGENPVARTLTTDLADLPDNPRAYTVTIPGEPLAEAGMCTLVIDGYADGKRARTVSARFKVSQAPIAPNPSEPTDPTPSQAEQLQKQIDAIMEDIADAAAAADAKEAAQASADAAAASQEAAAGSATAAAASAGAAASSAGAAASSAATAGQSAQAAQEAQGKAELAQNAAEDARDAARGSASDAAASAELAGQYAVQAGQSASLAGQYAGQADQSAQAATDAANAAASAQQGAEQARQAIENLGVEGETLDPGQQVAVVKTVGADGAVTLTFKIPQGAKGETGETGAQGETGPQGVSVTDAEVNQDGELTLTLSNQQTVNAGHVVGPQGPQGGQGEPGSSVASVQRTQGTGAAGTTDTYTMYNEDGEAVGTFQVYNGTNGTGSGDFMADGSVPMTGALQMGGNRVTNVGAPTAATDAVRKQEFDTAVDLASTAAQAAADASMAVEELEGSSPLAVKVTGESSYTYAANYTAYKIYQEAQTGRPVFASLGGAQYSLIECAALSASTYEAKFALVEDDKQKTLSITSTQTENTAISTGEINMGGGNYLPLSGGTMQGDVNFSAGEDPSMSRGVKFTVNMESAHLHGLNEGSGTILEASDQMGDLVRFRFADPVASTDGATKGYVDEAVSGSGGGDYLPLSGGTMTGNIDMNGKQINNALTVSSASVFGADGYDLTLWDSSDATSCIELKSGAIDFSASAQESYQLSIQSHLVDVKTSGSELQINEDSFNFFIGNRQSLEINEDGLYLQSRQLKDVAVPTVSTDAATKGYVDSAVANAGGGSSGAQIWRSEYAGTGTSTVETNGFGTGHIPDEVFIFPVDSSGADYFRAVLRRDGASRSYNFNGTCSSLYIMSFGANAISWDGPGGDGSMNASGVTYEMIGIKYSEIIN